MVSYNPWYFCVVCCSFSFSISNFIDLSLLHSLLDESANGLLILLIFTKKQFLVLLILLLSSSFFPIHFQSDLYDLSSSSDFGVVLFPVALGVILGYLMLLFLELGLYCYKYPS